MALLTSPLDVFDDERKVLLAYSKDELSAFIDDFVAIDEACLQGL